MRLPDLASRNLAALRNSPQPRICCGPKLDLVKCADAVSAALVNPAINKTVTLVLSSLARVVLESRRIHSALNATGM